MKPAIEHKADLALEVVGPQTAAHSTKHGPDIVPVKKALEKQVLIGPASPLKTPDPAPSTSDRGQEYAPRKKRSEKEDEYRDFKMLEFVNEQKFVTADQFQREFGYSQLSDAYRCLRKLVKWKMLRTERVLTHNKRIYMITRDAYGDGVTKDHGKLPYFHRPLVHQIEHDLKVTEVRIALTNLFKSSWIPERHYAAFARNKPNWWLANPVPVSDGSFWIGDEEVYVEVECSNKSEERTRETMQRWIDYDASKMTLYVATKEHVYRKLCQVLASLSPGRRSHKVAIARHSDLMTLRETIPVMTYDGPRFLPTEYEPKGAIHGNA